MSDYIVEFLIQQGITDIFGYPGGMVTHLMDSLGKNKDRITTHITFHEQAAAFAACGYAQASGKMGVAFATSGPGATNLLTGIGNAYFDSIPTLFITGQVNTFESKHGTNMRQRGFQETEIVNMVEEITKASFYVESIDQLSTVLEKAFRIAMTGRKGPVLLDIPMNIFRAEIDGNIPQTIDVDDCDSYECCRNDINDILSRELKKSKRPCIILGNGIKNEKQQFDLELKAFLNSINVPIVSSMLAVDYISREKDNYFGFIGAYGDRTANFIVAKADLVICLGTRLDVRQVGGRREQFAPNATIIRVDIDKEELKNRIRENDYSFCMRAVEAVAVIHNLVMDSRLEYQKWRDVCHEIRQKLQHFDEKMPNKYIEMLSEKIPDQYSIVADVGQHMVWVAQSFAFKPNQRVYFSGGMGSMGYALPASIGIYYATKRPVICFVGDGGFQMNIQELQFVAREQLPIKIVVLNNEALGMIRHFQEMYFDSNYFYTVSNNGYSSPDFVKVANAYGISAKKILTIEEFSKIHFEEEGPCLFDVVLKGDTYVQPKLEFGKPNQDQEPLIDRDLYQYLMSL